MPRCCGVGHVITDLYLPRRIFLKMYWGILLLFCFWVWANSRGNFLFICFTFSLLNLLEERFFIQAKQNDCIKNSLSWIIYHCKCKTVVWFCRNLISLHCLQLSHMMNAVIYTLLTVIIHSKNLISQGNDHKLLEGEMQTTGRVNGLQQKITSLFSSVTLNVRRQYFPLKMMTDLTCVCVFRGLLPGRFRRSCVCVYLLLHS